MRISTNGLELIKKHEGLRLRGYLCPAGIPTIGYGHTSTAVVGQMISPAQADKLLMEDVKECEEIITSVVKVPLTQNQFDALVSFVFNLGSGAFKASTLLKVINSKQYHLAETEFTKWVFARVPGEGMKKLPGLVARRNDEKKLFNTK